MIKTSPVLWLNFLKVVTQKFDKKPLWSAEARRTFELKQSKAIHWEKKELGRYTLIITTDSRKPYLGYMSVHMV